MGNDHWKNQPRVPAGNSNGGQFLSPNGYRQNTPYSEITRNQNADYILYLEDRKPTVIDPAERLAEEFRKRDKARRIYDSDWETSGAISGAIDADSKRGKAHAIRYYESIRKRKDDVPAIARNAGFSEDDIGRIKMYFFIDSHDLSDGIHPFVPDCDIARSWQRLIKGNYIEADLLLIRHELFEMELVDNGLPQSEAHEQASAKYNYAKAIREWWENGGNKKH